MADVFVEIGQVSHYQPCIIDGDVFVDAVGRQAANFPESPFDYLNAVTTGSIAAELATNLEQWYRPVTAMSCTGW